VYAVQIAMQVAIAIVKASLKNMVNDLAISFCLFWLCVAKGGGQHS
jgi:hypothetical protein